MVRECEKNSYNLLSTTSDPEVKSSNQTVLFSWHTYVCYWAWSCRLAIWLICISFVAFVIAVFFFVLLCLSRKEIWTCLSAAVVTCLSLTFSSSAELLVKAQATISLTVETFADVFVSNSSCWVINKFTKSEGTLNSRWISWSGMVSFIW